MGESYRQCQVKEVKHENVVYGCIYVKFINGQKLTIVWRNMYSSAGTALTKDVDCVA